MITHDTTTAPAGEGEGEGEGEAVELSDRQVRAVAALLTEPTIAKAAEVAGCDESTLRRWLRTEAFRAAHHAARRQAFDHVVGRLQGASGEALDTLLEVMRNKALKASSRVTAARAVLEHSRSVGAEDIVARLEQIERLLMQAEGVTQ